MQCTVSGVNDTITWRYGGVDVPVTPADRFSAEHLKENLKMDIVHLDDSKMTLHIQNMDVALVNGLRRLLLSEVPSISPETVHVWQNSGVMQDEVLNHRIGLVPFKLDCDELEYRLPNEDLSDRNAFKFSLRTGLVTDEMIVESMKSYPVYSKVSFFEHPITYKSM